MKTQLPDTPLGRALDIAGMVIERSNTIPILDNVLVRVTGGVMTITGTDLDIEVVAEVAGEAFGEDMRTTVSNTTLRNILAVRQVCAFVLLESSKLSVATIGNATFVLSTLPAGDYPIINQASASHSFRLAGADLLADLKAVRYGISHEETRYYLNGVYLHQREGMLRFAATDGHRLFRVTRPLPHGADGMPGVIIPRKAVKTLIAALERDPDDEVQVDVGCEKIRFILAGVTITSKVIDGAFPDYERVIPQASRGTLRAKASELLAAAEASTAIASKRTRAVQFLFGKDATVRATSPENGTMTMPCPGEVAGEMPDSLGLNASYFMDCCAPFGEAVIMVNIDGAAAPVLITSGDGEMSRLTVVQMPMRI